MGDSFVPARGNVQRYMDYLTVRFVKTGNIISIDGWDYLMDYHSSPRLQKKSQFYATPTLAKPPRTYRRSRLLHVVIWISTCSYSL